MLFQPLTEALNWRGKKIYAHLKLRLRRSGMAVGNKITFEQIHKRKRSLNCCSNM